MDRDPTQTPAAGDVIDGRYVVEAPLGAGTTGVVLRVRHHGTGRLLALKLLAPAADDAERFRREARALGGLYHSNIVTVTDSGVAADWGNRPYLVTEYLDGRSLRDVLAEPLARGRALDWLSAIAAAVDYAHAQGVLHRDLKPDNVIVCAGPGGTPTPKVLDFGLARWWRVEPAHAARAGDARHPRLTDADQLAGTPAYASPEQIRGGDVGPAADVYALGVMAYEMLAGRLPFEGALLDVLDAHLTQPPPRPATLPAELAATLLAALAKQPADRPRSATAFVDALRAADLRARRAAFERAARPRRQALAAVAALACACAPWALERSLWVQQLERRTQDWRWMLVPTRAPDPRLLLVSIDDESLARDARPLAEWGDDVAAFAARAFDAGAAGVAFDLLLPRQFGESPAFVDLVAAHADRLVLAASADEQGRLTGTEAFDAAAVQAIGPERVRAVFGLVNVAQDADGVCRSARTRFHDADGGTLPAWSLRAARLLDPRLAGAAIDDRVVLQANLRARDLERLPWHEAVSAARPTPERFRGRLLLLGAEYSASGDAAHAITLAGRRVSVSGLELQALLVASLLAELPVRETPSVVPLAALAALSAVIAGLGMARGRALQAAVVLAALATLHVVAGGAAFVVLRISVPVAAPALALLAAAAAVAAAARHPALRSRP